MFNEYEDARLNLSTQLRRIHGNWTLSIVEEDDDNGDVAWRFDLHNSKKDRIFVSGLAPTLEAAKAILAHALSDFGLKGL